MKPIIAIPATLFLCYRAYSHKSLTPGGIFAAFLTAIAHAVHPWNLPFALLVVFFLAGTRVTKVKKDYKATLTVGSQGTAGGEGPRNHVQVLANSVVASVFSIMHGYQLRRRQAALLSSVTTPGYNPSSPNDLGSLCFSWGGDLLVIGIIANYACVAADTFSSELGILARSEPRLITSPTLRKVPRGTNGGVTLLGLAAGLSGSMIIVAASMFFLPLCTDETAGKLGGGARGWSANERRMLMLGLAIWGALGSLMDSFLGGWFQRTVRDVRSGKIVEGEGGSTVLVSTETSASESKAYDKNAATADEDKDATAKDEAAVEEDDSVDKTGASDGKYDARDKHRRPSFGDEKPSRVVENGWDLLDNNDVNFLMAFIMSFGAMGVASWYWNVPMHQIFD
ncbi:hypothetical protein VTK73DRAFT_3143 [Phialemonium thermophilum]|uniref:Transmembrane protein 19 n=1 Tax=Phialemonium thermophilum TaxID=223376 RepID=A0ABR3X0I6_9PEZI